MSTPLRCCRLEDSLAHVAGLMWDYEIHVIPVVDDRGRPIGSITDRSICMTALRTRKSLAEIAARDALLDEVSTVRAEAPLGKVRRGLADGETCWLVVVDRDGTAVGFVTDGDVRGGTKPLRASRHLQGLGNVA